MGPWLIFSGVLRFRLKGSEWNLLSLDSEVAGGALDGGGDWLNSGGVSVSDLAGSSPTRKQDATFSHNVKVVFRDFVWSEWKRHF